jgi:predicted Zn-dependent peptidase
VKGPWKEVLRPDGGTVPGLDIVRGRIDSPGLDKAERFTLGNGLQLAILPRKGSPFVRVGLALPGANSPSEVARAHAAIRLTDAKLPPGCADGVRIIGTSGSEHYISTRTSGLRYALEVLACWTTASETEVVESQPKPAELAWLSALDQFAMAAPAAPLDQAPGWGRRWFRRTLRPAGATLVVVGDVSPAEVHAMAASVFSIWREPDGSQVVLGPAVLPAPAARTVVVADYPKSFAGWVGVMVRRQGPEAGTAPEQELLAWMLAARLRDRLPGGECRVRVRAVDSGPLTGLLVIVEGRSEGLVANLAQVLDELDKLHAAAADPAQLATARWNAVRRRTFAFSRTGSTTEELVDLSMLKLPPDGFEKLGDQYAGVSAERLEALWAGHAIGKEGILVAAPWEIVNPQLQVMGLEATRVVPVEQIGASDSVGNDQD